MINTIPEKQTDDYPSYEKEFLELYAKVEKAIQFTKTAPEVIEQTDLEFSRLTSFNKADYAFLFFATALQTARWIIQTVIKNSRQDHNAQDIEKQAEKAEDDFKNKHEDSVSAHGQYKDWQKIIADSVPYDINNGSKDTLGKGLSGNDHRRRTLGHDPYLGWIFGTANIMTDTLTTATEGSWYILREPKPHFGPPVEFCTIFSMAWESTKEDKVRLAAALCKQGIHLTSDKWTKKGLPIPFLSSAWPDLQTRLYNGGYDYLSLETDVAGAMMASMINFIIALLHDFCYEKEKYPNHDLYEVKTRKILLYSNLISSVSNIIYVSITAAMEKPNAWRDLDFGGLAVTIIRLFSDVEFIYRIKREFIECKFNEALQQAVKLDEAQLSAILDSLTQEDFVKINKNIIAKQGEYRMNNEQISKFADTLISVIPVWGYQYGKTQGFKDGMKKASEAYQKIFVDFQKDLEQIYRDKFGQSNIFVAPEGWDDQYWTQCLTGFLKDDKENLSIASYLYAFTRAFREYMEKKNFISWIPLTYKQLEIVQSVISTDKDQLIKLDPAALEIAIDFLSMFSPLMYGNKTEQKLDIEIRKLREMICASLVECSGCNILVLGRTGVGKSSLLNYLLGKEIFVSASGAPQTMGFDETCSVINNIKVNVFDSRGLETGEQAYSYHNFKQELNKFKQNHDIFQAPSNWLHAALYCLGERFQPVDCKIINDDLMKDKFNVIPVFTKMDGKSDEDMQKMKKELLEDCPNIKPENIVFACSINETTLDGASTEPFGKEELIAVIMRSYKDTMLVRIPPRCIMLAKKEIDAFCDMMKQEVTDHDMAWFRNDLDVKWFNDNLKTFQDKFNKEIFPKIVNRELATAFAAFEKMTEVFCSAESDTSQIDRIIEETWGKVIAEVFFGALGRNVAVKVGTPIVHGTVVRTVAVAGTVGITLPIINIGFVVYELWNKNGKIREKMQDFLNSFRDKLKEELDKLEPKIRENMEKIFKA